jgi:YegS/Rv2252/BmrU family lipid kinase
MGRVAIVYNPTAGQGRAGERLPQVEALLTEAGVDYDLMLTEYRGHGLALAARAAGNSSYRAVVAAGGDGTANEVINGLMAVRNTNRAIPALGVLCVGRGNDFAYGVGIPTALEEGVAAIRNGATEPIDLGFLKGGLFPEGRYFGNGIGIGFDTIVGFEAAKLKWIHGFLGYVVGAIKTLVLYYKAPDMTITTDLGTEERRCIQVSVMNGRRMGGAFYMAPEASPDDGYFDLCIAGTPKRRQMLGLITRYMAGSQASSPHIHTERSRIFTVRSDGSPLSIHADGETVSTEHTSLEVECIPRPILVIRPVPATADVQATQIAPA